MKFTNTFENGLNRDVNVINQPKGSYRDCQNGMLVSNDGNHYVMQTAQGNSVNFTIPPRYTNITKSGGFYIPSLDAPPLPIGFISFIDRLIVFSTNDTSTTGGYGEIGIVEFNNANVGTYTPIYHENNLHFTRQNKIFGFTYTESDKIERVYWTDDLNEIRVMNVQDPLLTTPIASGNLVAGTTYMVTGGAIEYPAGSGQYFGPGLPSTNIFTASSSNTYTQIDGNPVVTQYLSINLLTFNPDRAMGSIDFNGWLTNGSLNGGSNMYFYRLRLSNEGYNTSWSYGSFPINISGIPTTDYHQVVGAGQGGVLENSTRGIEIKISNIDTTFDTIEVAVAEFNQKENILTDAKVIFSLPITGSTMLFKHFGGENISALSVNDLTIFPVSVLRCKDMCTNKNYMVIANLKERDELEYSTAGITISDTIHYMPADQRFLDASDMSQGYGYQPASGIGSGGIVPDGQYQVSGGVIQYGGVNYNPGDTFTGSGAIGPNYTAVAGTPVVNACIIIRRYVSNTSTVVASGSLVAGTYYIVNGSTGDSITYNAVTYNPGQSFLADTTTVYTTTGGATVTLAKVNNKVIPIMDDYFDYRGMASTQYLRQYWTNETYRFAILFYDKKGNPYFARWIGDHAIWSGGAATPTGITNKGGLLIQRPTNSFSLTCNGITVSGITIPSSIINNISGFSIMRAPRDKQYMAQGVITPTVPDGANIRPMAVDALKRDTYANSAGTGVLGVYNWYSPDALFAYPDTNFINSGNILEGENFLTISPYISHGLAEETYAKCYQQAGNPSNPFHIPITTFSNINPQGSYGNILPGQSFENELIEPNAYGGAGRQGTGNKCALIRTQYSINYLPGSPGGYDISGPVALANEFTGLPIANYKIQKGTLYGGQSADAIAATPFISIGHFQEINSTILASLPVDANGNYVFNDIEVYGGDSFVGIVDYQRVMYNDTLGPGSWSGGFFFPIESNVNHYLRQGRHITKDGAQNQTNGVWFSKGGTTNLEDFNVNIAYTSDGDVFEYPALPYNFNEVNRYPFRVRWAGPKISGERFDAFRNFLANNYRDLDGQRGEINNLYAKMDKVFYWQNQAVGYLPILERQTVTGTLGEATQLGVGGVIDRFDAYDTYFGNQHQCSLVSTEFGFSWFDMRRRAWMIMNIGGQTQEISVAKGLHSFFNSAFDNQTFDGSIISTDKPLMGVGIHGVYDAKFKTTLMTFKDFVLPAFDDPNPYVNYDFTVGYNHVRDAIVGFFPGMTPAIWHQHNYQLISAKDANGKAIRFNKTYNVGDEVPVNNTEYVNIETFTTHNPVQPFEKPDAPGSLLWAKTYANNEVYMNWTGDVCKHYGRVYPHSLDIIVNPTMQEMFTVYTMQVKSSLDQNFDSVTYSTDTDTATDRNLNKKTRFYRVRDAVWENNTPIGKRGRLVDFYLKISFNLNNFLTNPTVSKNLEKVTVFVNSMFGAKY